jgi:hypothetical protein
MNGGYLRDVDEVAVGVFWRGIADGREKQAIVTNL